MLTYLKSRLLSLMNFNYQERCMVIVRKAFRDRHHENVAHRRWSRELLAMYAGYIRLNRRLQANPLSE